MRGSGAVLSTAQAALSRRARGRAFPSSSTEALSGRQWSRAIQAAKAPSLSWRKWGGAVPSSLSSQRPLRQWRRVVPSTLSDGLCRRIGCRAFPASEATVHPDGERDRTAAALAGLWSPRGGPPVATTCSSRGGKKKSGAREPRSFLSSRRTDHDWQSTFRGSKSRQLELHCDRLASFHDDTLAIADR